MASPPSARILACVDRLPLAPGLRVLEIGCGPGVAAREVARRIGSGKVVAIDRSAKAIALATAGSAAEFPVGTLEFRVAAIEDFELEPGEQPFDLAFAMRVGVLDGRHPSAAPRALARLRAALRPSGLLFIDDQPPIVGADLCTSDD